MQFQPDQSVSFNENVLRDIVVVIPCHNEQTLVPTLDSLFNQDDELFSLILTFNAAENDSDSKKMVNQLAYDEARQWLSEKDLKGSVELLLFDQLPDKLAGVGLARKLGMDHALEKLKTDGKKGVLVNLDADCLVSENYVSGIRAYYRSNPEIQAANIYFEHRDLHKGIILYELHLRYFVQALKFLEYPFPYHTVGSCMSVRSDTYENCGGMNTRKAGEDFYFLQKLFTQYTFGEINDVCVYPSSRISDRVPFGTGKSMKTYEERGDLQTYDFRSFLLLKDLFGQVQKAENRDDWEKIDGQLPQNESFMAYLKERKWTDFKSNMLTNFKSSENRRMSFYRWFNNFQIIKYLHHMRDGGFPDVNIIDSCNDLLESLGIATVKDSAAQLDIFRKLDKLADKK